MAVVSATTDQLDDWLKRRHELGLDTYDEWWEGVYRVVTGPSPEHGRLLNKLAVFLDPLVDAAGLHSAAPINIGTDKANCRVPDMGIYHPDTARTSKAFLSTALMVIEVLSPGERPGEKLDFYREWNVQEYLEIDLEQGTTILLINRVHIDLAQGTTMPLVNRVHEGWAVTRHSKVLPLIMTDSSIMTNATGAQLVIADFAP